MSEYQDCVRRAWDQARVAYQIALPLWDEAWAALAKERNCQGDGSRCTEHKARRGACSCWVESARDCRVTGLY